MSDDNPVKYNNTFTTGFGYLNRFRVVHPKQGTPYKAVSINALLGTVASPAYVQYDCKCIVGRAAQKILLLQDAINDTNCKVLVAFRVSDTSPDSYVIEDRVTGEQVRKHCIRARFIDITWASINGKTVEFVDEDSSENTESDAHPSENAEPGAQSSENAESVDEPVVILDPEDPEYRQKQVSLLRRGYEYDSGVDAFFAHSA